MTDEEREAAAQVARGPNVSPEDRLNLTLTRLSIEQAALRADNRRMREDLDEMRATLAKVEDLCAIQATTLEDLEQALGRIEDSLARDEK